MGSDTDRLPALDEDSDELADTIVLTDSDVMATREMRTLLDLNEPPEDKDRESKDGENDED